MTETIKSIYPTVFSVILEEYHKTQKTLNVLFYDLLAEETYRHIISIDEGISQELIWDK